MLERLLEPGPKVQEGYPRSSLIGWGARVSIIGSPLGDCNFVAHSTLSPLWAPGSMSQWVPHPCEAATAVYPVYRRTMWQTSERFCSQGGDQARLQVLRHRQYGSNVLSDQCPEQMWVSTLGEMEFWARDVG